MNDILLVLIFLIIGYFSGILVGILGIGGGVIFVPVLYLLLPFTKIDFNQIAYITVATSLFAGSFAAVSSGSNHLLKKNVDLKRALLLSSGSIISSSLTPYFVVTTKQLYIQIIFAFVFSFIAIKMFLENGIQIKMVKFQLSDNYLFVFGFLIGIIAAFAGIGGGILFVPLLIYLYSLDVKKAIGTSAVTTAFTMISSSISFSFQNTYGTLVPYQFGYIYLLAGIPLAVGSATGAFNGVKIQQKTTDSSIKKIFSLVILIIVLKIIFDMHPDF